LEPNECHYAYNILPSQDGFQTRDGTAEWCNGVDGSPRTIIPYASISADGTGDKIFVTGEDGIYDCTGGGAGGATLVYSFATTGVTAGYGNFIIWTSATGAAWILYADSANGLLQYEVATDTWSAKTDITGLSELDVRYVAIHKLRIWVVLKNSPNAWYLPVGAIAGAAAEFQLGSKFTHGGDCSSIHTFTRDAGNGPDDLFVAISRAGDVIVYQGADPSSASTFSIVGTWYVGTVPNSRKFAIEYSGDIYILSVNGLTSLSELLRGTDVSDNYKSVVGKITNVLRSRMKNELNIEGWEVLMYPAENFLLIRGPTRNDSIDQYLVYCLNTVIKAWGFIRGVEMTAMGVLRDKLYFTKSDGSLWYFREGTDNSSIAAPDGEPVTFSFLTAYSDLGAPGVYKNVVYLRPVFIGDQTPQYSVKALFNYNLNELTTSGSTSGNDQDVWDTGEWDSALWGGNMVYGEARGTGGWGYAVAVAVRGRAISRLTLAEINGAFVAGGYL